VSFIFLTNIFDQVHAFSEKQNHIVVTNDCNNGKKEEEDNDDYSTVKKTVTSDQLWMLSFSLTQSPNIKKLMFLVFFVI